MSDLYPLDLLAGFELMPTGVDRGVMAVCRRHDGEVSALVVNSVSKAPLLGDLAVMAAEHEAEHHHGPPIPNGEADQVTCDGQPGPPCTCAPGIGVHEAACPRRAWLHALNREYAAGASPEVAIERASLTTAPRGPGAADPNCVYPNGQCTCGEPEGHTAPNATGSEDR